MADRLSVCVVGAGRAGRMHTAVLAELGADVSTVDPAAGPLRDVPLWRDLDEALTWGKIDVWDVCTPTDAHLPVLRRLLDADPAARVILEKPACGPHQIAELAALLDAHPLAGSVIVDQYRRALAAQQVATMLRDSGAVPTRVGVAFTKDRAADERDGRFVDTRLGVFGYEWSHQLAMLGVVLPEAVFDAYLHADPELDDIAFVAGQDGITTAAERTVAPSGTALELYSTVAGDRDAAELPPPAWTRGHPVGYGGRQRLLVVDAPGRRITVQFDPVGRLGSRNVHSVGVRDDSGSRGWLVHDSPLHTALRAALRDLTARDGQPRADLRAMHRLAALAALAQSQPHHQFSRGASQ
jgi:predicted dehydrogenase